MSFSLRGVVAYVTVAGFLLYFLSAGTGNPFKFEVKGFLPSIGM